MAHCWALNQENPLLSLVRPRLLAGAALLAALGAVALHQGSRRRVNHDRRRAAQNMEELLTAVTKDVDAYWTKTFADAGLQEPRV